MANKIKTKLNSLKNNNWLNYYLLSSLGSYMAIILL